MKKLKISLLVLAMMFAFSINAQDFRIGLSLAPSISFNKAMVKVNDQFVIVDTLKSGGLGFKGGLWADYGFAKNYYLHSGILVHSKNFNSDVSNMKVTTVEVPLALKMRTNEVAENIRILGFFGATLDINVSAKEDNVVVTGDINKIGTSFIFGAGAEYNVGFGNINLGLSYHLGMTDISSENDFRIMPRHLSVDFAFYFN
jgi:hypothetical protein